MQYQWFWYNLTNESMYYKYQRLAVDQTILLLLKQYPNYQLTLAVLHCLPPDPPLVTLIHVNEGEERHRKTERKFVNKHLLRRGLLLLEINGVVNKPLLLKTMSMSERICCQAKATYMPR